MSDSGEEFMEFLDFLEDLEPGNSGRPRIVRPRPNYFSEFDDIDFFKRYRMSKQAALFLLERIDESLEYSSNRNDSVSPVNQLLITLRFYATGNHLLAVGDFHGVHVSTVSRIVKRVTRAIVHLRQEHIKFPDNSLEIETCQRDFYQIANFPFVLGTIDCTHVKIQSPGGEDAELFRNRKGTFSINVQTISDAQMRVRNVVSRWPGSTHDSAIFSNSQIFHDFESGQYGNAFLLGDSGYPLKNYLLTPYLIPRTVAEEHYNVSHIKTRNTVERQYGIMKRRFPALAIGLRIKLETAVEVIVACCILHNICIDFREDMPPNEFEDNYLQNLIDGGQHYNNLITNVSNNDRRALITRNFFNY